MRHPVKPDPCRLGILAHVDRTPRFFGGANRGTPPMTCAGPDESLPVSRRWLTERSGSPPWVRLPRCCVRSA